MALMILWFIAGALTYFFCSTYYQTSADVIISLCILTFATFFLFGVLMDVFF